METKGTQDLNSGSGRVLVMDDEESVREVTCRMLQRLGYDVDEAESGGVAVEKYCADPYDFVFMDLTVPGEMGGQEATELLLEHDPDAVVIVASGYSHDPVMANYRDHGFRACLTKPFGIADLSDVLHEIR